MNYRDLQNISNLSQQILVEGANEEHNVLNRWPYTSPYLQESTELDEAKEDSDMSPVVKRQVRNNRIRSDETTTEPELQTSRRVMHTAMRGQKNQKQNQDLLVLVNMVQ